MKKLILTFTALAGAALSAAAQGSIQTFPIFSQGMVFRSVLDESYRDLTRHDDTTRLTIGTHTYLSPSGFRSPISLVPRLIFTPDLILTPALGFHTGFIRGPAVQSQTLLRLRVWSDPAEPIKLFEPNDAINHLTLGGPPIISLPSFGDFEGLPPAEQHSGALDPATIPEPGALALLGLGGLGIWLSRRR